MSEDFVPIGEWKPDEIAAKLRELSEDDTLRGASFGALESAGQAWLYTQHQFGFIAPFVPGSARYHPIVAAGNMPADDSLRGQRVNLRLDFLRVYSYPRAWFAFGTNVHSILFTFEARSQIEPGGEEPVAFSQLYKARAGQDAAVTGQPIFSGLTVGHNGIGFSCRTVNVANSSDEALVNTLNSEAVSSGLSLLTTAQPALAPLTTIARGLCVSLAKRRRNVPVQEVFLGLDFDSGATGARLAVGSYVVAQTERADEINWGEWVYDADTGTIMRHPESLAEGELTYPLPYNAFVFRVSRYTEPGGPAA